MKTKTEVKHIPERGCHNCRLHCVNHKECDSEYPCKQGMEWRPILPIPNKKTAEEILIKYCGEIELPNNECITVYYPSVIAAMEEFTSQSQSSVSDEAVKDFCKQFKPKSEQAKIRSIITMFMRDQFKG